jgi:hypothetical protein
VDVPPPIILFSDLQSGPNSGGERGAGVYVTIVGRHFGPVRGASTVIIGGGEASAYPIWSDTKITVQLGPRAASGPIIATVGGRPSNSIPFQVRPGHVYFVAARGHDAASGSFAAPWRTIAHAVSTLTPGDTVYVMDGVSESNRGTSDGSVTITTSGAPGLPNALLAYPGAIATIGAEALAPCDRTDCIEGLGTVDPNPQSWWVIGGLRLRGNDVALGTVGPAEHWRIVGNDISCPFGDGSSGCVLLSQTSFVEFFGNAVHDAGWRRASAEYHGLYFSTDSNHLDVGWNVVANVQGCRGLHIHSSPLNGGGADDPTGRNQYDIVIHHNVIHDTTCDGMVLSTIDPSRGRIEIVDNVLYSVGKGPLPPDGGGNFSGIYITGETNTGRPGGGTVDVRNNTLYDCGAYSRPGSLSGSSSAFENGGANPDLKLQLTNNIAYQKPGQAYVFDWDTRYMPPTSRIMGGSHNLFYGSNAPRPRWLANTIAVDPLFVDLERRNFQLQPTSPARLAGICPPPIKTGNLMSAAGAPQQKWDTRGNLPLDRCDLGARHE